MNNQIQEAYCSFEVSKLMEEKGFMKAGAAYTLDGQFWINSNLLNESITGKPKPVSIPCPTHALAIEWIRVNFGIWITVGYLGDGYNCTVQNKQGYTKKAMGNFNTPQEATEAGLLYTLQKLIP